MFDPTVFENVKIALENLLYSLDNVDEVIYIDDRKDLVDLAVMSRSLLIGFHLRHDDRIRGELLLEATTENLAGEILEEPNVSFGCSLTIAFYMTITNPERECSQIERVVQALWSKPPVQQLTYVFREEDSVYENKVILPFDEKVGEEHIHQLPDLIEIIVLSMKALEEGENLETF